MKEHEKILNLLGQQILKLREQQGLSLSELSRRCDKDRQSLFRVEKGKVNVSVKYLNEICKGLNVSIKDLFDFEENSQHKGG